MNIIYTPVKISIMKEDKIVRELLNEFKSLKPDLVKFKGNPAPAYAEQLIKFINILTPHAHLFEDDFKIAIKKYITVYEAARKNEKEGEDIFKLVKPTHDLIMKTLERKLTRYN